MIIFLPKNDPLNCTIIFRNLTMLKIQSFRIMVDNDFVIRCGVMV